MIWLPPSTALVLIGFVQLNVSLPSRCNGVDRGYWRSSEDFDGRMSSVKSGAVAVLCCCTPVFAVDAYSNCQWHSRARNVRYRTYSARHDQTHPAATMSPSPWTGMLASFPTRPSSPLRPGRQRQPGRPASWARALPSRSPASSPSRPQISLRPSPSSWPLYPKR
jgi:hypothetical protein